MGDRAKTFDRLAADALRGTVRRDRGRDAPTPVLFNFANKLVVLAIRDRRRSVDVVSPIVLANLVAEFGDLFGRRHGERTRSHAPRGAEDAAAHFAGSKPHSGTTVTERPVAELGIRHRNRIGSLPVLRNW